MTTPSITLPVDIEQIQKLLPHRYPFLLVDRVIEVEMGKRITSIKNVTFNEPCFQGHFPGHPVMPGVLIIEALAQTAGCLFEISTAHDGSTKRDNPIYYLVKIDNARFSAMVVPGDQLRMEVTLKRFLRGMGLFDARALVDGNEVASCVLMCASRAD